MSNYHRCPPLDAPEVTVELDDGTTHTGWADARRRQEDGWVYWVQGPPQWWDGGRIPWWLLDRFPPNATVQVGTKKARPGYTDSSGMPLVYTGHPPTS